MLSNAEAETEMTPRVCKMAAEAAVRQEAGQISSCQSLFAAHYMESVDAALCTGASTGPQKDFGCLLPADERKGAQSAAAKDI